MRTVNLAEEPLDLAAVLHLAGQEPVLLLTPDGKGVCAHRSRRFRAGSGESSKEFDISAIFGGALKGSAPDSIGGGRARD